MIHPIILCGGSGSRLWPLSCSDCPKQFLKIFNGDKSLLQITLMRFKNDLFEEPILITNSLYLDKIYDQIKEVNLSKFTIIVESNPMSTAPAIALAAFHIQKHFKNNLMLVIPSDSIMGDSQAFLEYIKKAEKHVKEYDDLLLFGINPTYAETGFGYINPSKEDDKEIKKIVKFTEKPTLELAESYIKQGYLWNSGIFMFSANKYLEELSSLEADMYENCKIAYNSSLLKDNIVFVQDKSYSKCKAVSIDYAIMEKTKNIVVIPMYNVKWNDVGSWKSIYDLSPKDEKGNVFIGNVKAIECSNCFVYSPDVLTAIHNVHDQVIINVDNKSLSISLYETQKVKDLTNILNKNVKYNKDILIS